jgi:hypothetical protein
MNGAAENSAHESAEAHHRSGKLLGYLQKAGIDAVPVRDGQGACTGELVLFFADDQFLIRVDERTPVVWLKETHLSS